MNRHDTYIALIVGGVALLTGSAIADSITFHGSTIPLRDCRISAIQSGRVQYVDPNNRRQMRDIREIKSLSFDGLAPLDEAENLLESDQPGAAVLYMLRALRASESDLQRLWLRYRLATVHDALGQHAQSVAHVAEVLRMTGSTDWAFIRPFTEPAPAPFAATHEAMTNLERARREVRSPELRSVIDELIQTLQPIHAEAERNYDGPPIAIGSTLSGIAIDVIDSEVDAFPAPPIPGGESVGDEASSFDDSTSMAADDHEDRSLTSDSPVDDDAPMVIMPRPEEQLPVSPNTAVGPAASPNSAPAIDALLREGSYSDALLACEEVSRDPGDRELGRFLLQYGHALAGAGRVHDAAVMFTRCAVLYDGTPDAVGALIETARIYRDTYDLPATAVRLLQRAITRAELLELDADVAVARALIASMNEIDL